MKPSAPRREIFCKTSSFIIMGRPGPSHARECRKFRERLANVSIALREKGGAMRGAQSGPPVFSNFQQRRTRAAASHARRHACTHESGTSAGAIDDVKQHRPAREAARRAVWPVGAIGAP
jgi:hypothetical protein